MFACTESSATLACMACGLHLLTRIQSVVAGWSPRLEAQLQRHLHLPGLVLLIECDAAELRASGVGLGSGEADVVEGVEDFEAVLQPELLAELEVLEHATIDVVDAAGANSAPARR